jgi:hypothetical protein
MERQHNTEIICSKLAGFAEGSSSKLAVVLPRRPLCCVILREGKRCVVTHNTLGKGLRPVASPAGGAARRAHLYVAARRCGQGAASALRQERGPCTPDHVRDRFPIRSYGDLPAFG